ncbi:MAG: hypothetical protein ACC661_12920, partial [Verrucomicrobiales bacterium]
TPYNQLAGDSMAENRQRSRKDFRTVLLQDVNLEGRQEGNVGELSGRREGGEKWEPIFRPSAAVCGRIFWSASQTLLRPGHPCPSGFAT